MLDPASQLDLARSLFKLLRGRAIPLIPTLFIPAFVASIILGQYTSGSSLSGSEEPISALELRRVGAENGQETDDGMTAGLLLWIEPTAGSFKIPWSDGTPAGIWSSADPAVHDLNGERLRISTSELSAEFPLYGLSDPLLLLAEGASARELVLPGVAGSRDIPSLRLSSGNSRSIALGGLVISMFGLGLSANTARELRTESE